MKRLAFATLALAAAAAHAQTLLPVRTLSALEIFNLSGQTYLSPGTHPFEVSGAARATAFNENTGAQPAVQRKTGSNAAVYQGSDVANPPLLPTVPAGASLANVSTASDAAQAWSTMTASGVPYLYVRGLGEFEAEATAGWNTTVTMPANASREVVVRFVVPEASVSGVTHQQAPARWRSRLRGELLVNGFPAWSAEAIRYTPDFDPGYVGNCTNETIVLQTFGRELPFPTNDEDTPPALGGPANDSSCANVHLPSAPQVVHLTLGRFAAGAVVDLSMILRGSAGTVPMAPGGTDHRCRWDGIQTQWYCSQAGVSMTGPTGEPPRVYLLP